MRPTDSVVVYYAGHGVVVDATQQGLLDTGHGQRRLPETWISNRDIGRMMGSIRASQVVLISDSCFSGGLVGERRPTDGERRGPTRGPTCGRRAVLAMSSGGDEPVADGARNGHCPSPTA